MNHPDPVHPLPVVPSRPRSRRRFRSLRNAPSSPRLPLAIAAILGLWLAAIPAGAAGDLFVAPGGDDTAAGTEARPLATLARARDVARARIAAGALDGGGLTIHIAAGTYTPRAPITLGPEDSGRPGAPVLWRAAEGAAPRISGGRAVTGWRPVTRAERLARLAPEARGHVLRAELAPLGIDDLGEVAARGNRLELFFLDEPQTLARWPNEGFTRIAGLAGEHPFQSHGRSGNRDGLLEWEGDRPAGWRREPEVWLHGYWFWDWSDSYARVDSIDPERRLLALAPPYHGYGYRKGQRFYALNLLSELDRPGEWYADRAERAVWFWPPAPIDSGAAVLSVLPHLFVLQGASHVELRGLTLEATRDTAVVIQGGEEVRVTASTIRNSGSQAVRVSGGARHAVRGCDMYRLGEGGISLSGGDRETLEPAGHRAENNHIHHFGRLWRTYRPAVAVSGVGQIVAHNRIHDGPHNAIQLSGNDHRIELNEIYHVCFETGDVGAFYMGRDWTARGTVIRNNFFHDIEGPGLYGAMAVYLDDAASGITVRGNVFARAGRAAFIGGGRDNLVENNIFVDCPASVHIDARGMGWMSDHVQPGGTLPKRLEAMPYRESPWRERYPELLRLLEEAPGEPRGNIVRRNISFGGRWLDVEKKALPLVRFEKNLVARDPRFVDPDRLDYQLRPDSPACEIGFERIPFEEIGLVRDADRSDASGRPPGSPRRPDPPGPGVRRVASDRLVAGSFRPGQPIVGTYYFYWYDYASKAHFVDGDGTDAMTRHPVDPEGTSYLSKAWHRRQLEDLRAAGLDFLLPVYWGTPDDHDGWSFRGLPPLVAAARELEAAGKRPPRIGCFYDTSTLRHNPSHYHADLATARGREWLYLTVRDFFSLIPSDLWAAVDGHPLVWLYSATFASRQDPAALGALREEFQRDFGVSPYIVKEVSWPGEADATYAWGAALGPKIYTVAAVGPGYDHSAVPGRAPLVRDREDGEFYRRSWSLLLARPVALRPAIAVVETWNEWHEGTDIAPSRESGRKYVELTRQYAEHWRRGDVLAPRGKYGKATEVSVDLGAEPRGRGIELAEHEDGKTRAIEAAGKEGRATVATGHGGRYLYFDVDDSFYFARGGAVEVTVEFLDRGRGEVPLEYDSLDPDAPHAGAFKRTVIARREDRGRWRTAKVDIADAAFTGRSNGHDFRLVDTDGALVVRRVTLRRAGKD